jgi:integrase
MARKVSFSALESRSARLRLKVRRRPYSGPSLARGISLMYRRNGTNGTWVIKASDGQGRYWTKGFALADDFEDADAKKVLTFHQAQDAARKLARGEDGSADNAPVTVDGALRDYKRDLEAREANGYNAQHPRIHLTSALLSKPVALLTANELKKWRDSLLGTMAPTTINRLGRCLCAALELAARHDERIKNRQAWQIGLANLPDAQEARNIVLSDDEVRAFVASAYSLDDGFGLFADTMAVTGARPSQLSRLRVGDLRCDHALRPKLAMPRSGKGGGRLRSERKAERYSVPISTQLAARLKLAVKGRADDVPLLVQSDGCAWGNNPGQRYHREVSTVVTAIGIDPDATMYCLRHSSITRALLQNVPIRLVASLHDTSVVMIERHYSKYIVEHSDDISRRALLQHEPQVGGEIVTLAS